MSWAFRKVTVETLGGPREQSEVYKTSDCPEEYLVDGAVPGNWRRHHAAVMAEAKAIGSENEDRLLSLLAGGSWDDIQRSPLVGVSDIKKDSKRANKIKGLQVRLRAGKAKGQPRGKG